MSMYCWCHYAEIGQYYMIVEHIYQDMSKLGPLKRRYFNFKTIFEILVIN